MSQDYTSFIDKDDNILVRLTEAADEQLQAQTALEVAETETARAKKVLKELQEVKIPELMDEAKMTQFTTDSGLKIKVKENIRASISAANMTDAFAWLRENGHEALIKREVKVMFGKGEDGDAASVVKALQEQDLMVDDKSSVHAGTLAKFVREKLEAGEEVPMELLGVFRQRVSTVTV